MSAIFILKSNKLYTIIKDIDLINDTDKFDIILVGTNTYHTMGNGFQRKIRLKYSDSYHLNLTTRYGDKKKLGTTISTNGTPRICLCFITNGYNFRPDLTPDYLDYDALEKCLKWANIEFSGLRVATTLIGGSKFDGNGEKNRILDIISSNSDKMDLYLYDYEQIDWNIEKSVEYLSIVRNKNYDRRKKIEMLKNIPDENSPIENAEKRLKRIKKEVKDLLNKK